MNAVRNEQSPSFEFGAGGAVESFASEVLAGDHCDLLDAVLALRGLLLACEFEDRSSSVACTVVSGRLCSR
jgi:hypothetical protein